MAVVTSAAMGFNRFTVTVDGKRLALLALVAAAAIWALGRLERPAERGGSSSSVDLQELLLDGVPFSKIGFRLRDVRVRFLDNPERRPVATLARRGRALAAWNGGFFEPDFRPSGLLVQDGRTLSPMTERGGSGIWIVRGRRSSIAPRADYRATPAPDLAVQGGPILIEPGGRLGIRAGRGPTAARTAICVTRRETSVYVTWERITLHRLARVLKAQGCDAALNLDGGPSTCLYVRGRVGHEPAQPVRTVIALVAR
ncbi:MAG: phosphodiester glycosidase family protein [Deltaproteobacteria bacterium]|nr:phosphodiester glycosidase family protein [Deltaproteobacteria bacterium]